MWHSLTSLLADLATVCANQIQPTDDMPAFTMITSPTPPQLRAFELLGVSHRHGLAQAVHPHHQTAKPQLNPPTRQPTRGELRPSAQIHTSCQTNPQVTALHCRGTHHSDRSQVRLRWPDLCDGRDDGTLDGIPCEQDGGQH